MTLEDDLRAQDEWHQRWLSDRAAKDRAERDELDQFAKEFVDLAKRNHIPPLDVPILQKLRAGRIRVAFGGATDRFVRAGEIKLWGPLEVEVREFDERSVGIASDGAIYRLTPTPLYEVKRYGHYTVVRQGDEPLQRLGATGPEFRNSAMSYLRNRGAR